MKKNIIIFIALVIYLVSIWGVYDYCRISHSKGGICEHVDARYIEIFITFTPIINTVSFIQLNLISSPIKSKKEKDERNLNNFFNVKK